jgi:hypothetical protein
VSLLPFVEWLAATRGSIALHESQYAYPLVESTHVLALALFAGTVALLDLRLLGIGLRGVPVSHVVERVLPWTIAGFVIMTVTGALLFYAIPVRTYQSIFFRAKVLMLIGAGLNVLVFHRRVKPTMGEWSVAGVTPAGARRAGAISLVLWAGVIVTGRMIAYNWFDCDIQPQPALVNLLAGCVVPAPQ